MPRIRHAALLSFLALQAPVTALAANSTCVVDRDIVSETRPDDSTILFTLRNHQVWKNSLPTRCFGLQHEPDGFTFQPTDPGTGDLCSGEVTIRLNSFRTTCLLGDFKRLK